ncbi:uncharacterized protein LOC116160352 [Photinus pyralis]|uniref:uncharacterized protein LOC116158693 n=1 Tax=Photinus pyralis TaxID=7054 RepID=UPI00126768EE|nr:uncharacterized protein LOC116158693 [Photinus pyralis]XP_031328315.1 uncharacterized protein LOC116159479 [Photinus pyralis]XP_031329382.1 uncharacterized protein LOC116160334 [Photinus pyralis]XP_031329401.1 uncharacterized protein LOC116160352 [Photinus pyralis]
MDRTQGSRGNKLVMLALNKKTKQTFQPAVKIKNRETSEDLDYYPTDTSSQNNDSDSDTTSECKEENKNCSSNLVVKSSAGHGVINDINSGNSLTEISPVTRIPSRSPVLLDISSSIVPVHFDTPEVEDSRSFMTEVRNSELETVTELFESTRSFMTEVRNSELETVTELFESITEAVEPPVQGEVVVADPDDFVDIDGAGVSNNASVVQYTKKGTVRKRKKFELSVSSRKKAKHESLAKKHCVKDSCGKDCLKKCVSKISEERKQFLNSEFWKMSNDKDRKSFILHHISSRPVKQRTTLQSDLGYQRNITYNYALKNENGTSQNVCKTFFLATLGFNKQSDKVIRTALRNANNSVVPVPDLRCRKQPHNKIDDEVIRNHIVSYNPTISHYRREHAPQRLYLPSDLTFAALHQDFLTKHPDLKISYEKYRVVAKKMNISLANLGHEECESCEGFSLHDKSHTKDNLEETCDVCRTWKKHIDRATKSREHYRDDGKQPEEAGKVMYCADLEKVIMLPRLETFKTAIFTSRITVYNESFVPIGKKKNSKTFAAVWHDALFKRSKDEIISAFYQFVLMKRDAVKITLWLDNCSAQNKNWSFFSFLLYIVNSDEINANEIVIKYFEPGHTFMAADSFHHKVELSMKKMGNKLYDFGDFVQAVKQASRQTEVLPMELQHFFIWEDYTSQYKLSRINPRPYLNEIVQVSVHRGSLIMTYQNDFDAPIIELDFLSAKITKNKKLPPPKKQQKVLGIPSKKKAAIIKNLGAIMKNRLQFWNELPVSQDEDSN